jgi:hypothetical protein
MGKAIALDLVGAVQDGSLSVMIVSSSFFPIYDATVHYLVARLA